MTERDPLEPVLRSGMQSLGLHDDATQIQQLLTYLRLLERWNRVYNLTAVRDPAAMLSHHLLDSLAVVPPLRRHWAENRDSATAMPRVVDVGSGGGLPGVVVAITNPAWSVTCVDAVGKKVGFIRQTAAELALRNLQAQHGRVEQLSMAPANLVTARAFSTLSDFVNLTRKVLHAEGCWVAMKGQHPAGEIASLPRNVQVFHVEPLTVPELEAQRCLVWMRPNTEH